MIHKVYIVRCSQCHASLRDTKFFDYRPRYFYSIDSIAQALSEANWKVINGTEICNSCCNTSGFSTEL
jgi:hypothetical protein